MNPIANTIFENFIPNIQKKLWRYIVFVIPCVTYQNIEVVGKVGQ